MQNLEQIRAKHALEASRNTFMSGKEGGEVIKKIPPLIINHGLLATAAYGIDAGKGYEAAMDAIARHLASLELISKEATDNKKMLEYLTQADSNKLRICTAETMAWLDYARRLIKKG